MGTTRRFNPFSADTNKLKTFISFFLGCFVKACANANSIKNKNVPTKEIAIGFYDGLAITSIPVHMFLEIFSRNLKPLQFSNPK